MKVRFRLFLTIQVLLVALGCDAQERPLISSGPPAPPAQYPLVREIGIARVSFNSKKNETISSAGSVLVFGKDFDGLSIGAEFVSAGTKVIEPRFVTVKIFFMGNDRTYLDDRTVKVFVEDKEIADGTSKFISANSSNVIFGLLEYEIPFNDVVKISEASKVRLQIGPSQFELTQGVIGRFKNLIQTIER